MAATSLKNVSMLFSSACSALLGEAGTCASTSCGCTVEASWSCSRQAHSGGLVHGGPVGGCPATQPFTGPPPAATVSGRRSAGAGEPGPQPLPSPAQAALSGCNPTLQSHGTLIRDRRSFMAFRAQGAPTGTLASSLQDSGTRGSGSKAAGAAGPRAYAIQTAPTARDNQCRAEWAAAVRRPGATPLPTPSRPGDSNGCWPTALPVSPRSPPRKEIPSSFPDEGGGHRPLGRMLLLGIWVMLPRAGVGVRRGAAMGLVHFDFSLGTPHPPPHPTPLFPRI